ncbi:T9SS type A sorting domain-containing protein [Dyadobacter sp. 676]|uniref:T9SS type A sorting domain-containing protein n=1 Tax=Dyadobacter sp. 676 TaxID=3088362 RepID=A0AAU8FJ91_9BACT
MSLRTRVPAHSAQRGASAVALEAYNNEEYWDISPIGSATGKVTISWDDFRNPSITASENVNVFSVAHLTGGNWLNEGSNASGILAAGSVTSEAISSWSPFTLGAIPGAGMPVTMVGFDGRIVENGALLEWQTTSEANASHFEVERSTDARTFQKIGSVVATGYSSGPQRYSFVDKSFGSQRQTVYYRLRSVDFDGTFSLTRAISLKPESNAGMAGVYPNPAGKSTSVTVTSRVPADKVSLWDLLGRQIPVRTSQMPDGSVQVGLTGVVPGAYVLKVATGHGTESRKLIIE